jgi:hypothetical protein
VAFLHLAVLWGFAVAQPLFELLGGNAEFFATRGSEGVELVVFGLLLVAAPPAALLAAEMLAGLALPPLRRTFHLAFVGGLVAVLALQVLKRLGDPGAAVSLAAAVVAGAGAALAYARLRGLRSFLTALAPAPLVFLALFLAAGPVARLVFADEGGARSAGVAARAPVVLIVFDELPLISLLDARGRIDERRYPNFAALARTSTWFRNATGVHDRTSKAVPAVLSGDRPRPGALPIAADHPRSIFTLLGGSYRMNVHEEATSVCPDDLCRQADREGGLGHRARSLGSDLAVVLGHVVLPQDLSARLPSVSEGWENFAGEGAAEEASGGGRAGDAPRGEGEQGGKGVDELARGLTQGLRGGREARFDRFVASLAAGAEERTLSFEHAFFPHAPFDHLPSGRRYLRDHEESIDGLVPPSGTDPLRDRFAASQAYARHLLQVGYADRLLGRALARLREREGLDRALVVVAADHGATFGVGRDRRAVTRDAFADVAAVPLFVKAPGQREGEVRDAYAQTTDILPTVADVLDVRPPWPTAGRSAFDPALAGRRRVTMWQGAERRARISRGANDRAITVSTEELERQQRAALARKLAIFGPGLDPFALGPNSELRGRRVADLEVARNGRAGVRAELDAPDELRAVGPRSGFVPAQLTGRVRSAAPRKRPVAIAVNGRIAAVAETFFMGGDGVERLSVLIPEAAFRPGRNDVEVFEVEGAGTEARLRPLGRFGRPPGG